MQLRFQGKSGFPTEGQRAMERRKNRLSFAIRDKSEEFVANLNANV